MTPDATPGPAGAGRPGTGAAGAVGPASPVGAATAAAYPPGVAAAYAPKRRRADGLRLRGVGKVFDSSRGPVQALSGIDLDVRHGEFVCIVGASGSGKSTLLSIIAGLYAVSTGVVTLDGMPVTKPGPERGLVCQSGALYPWRSVEANVAFGLELLPISRADRTRRVSWYLQEVGLTHLAHSLPGQLSGGQRQRVAIARALACEPQVLLLDEPFGALDVQTKEDMQVFLRKVWVDTGTTIAMVTHDVEEAVFLGQRVVVLASDPGRVAADIAVDLPPERALGIRRSPEFLALRAQVEDLVRVHHQAHLRLTSAAAAARAAAATSAAGTGPRGHHHQPGRHLFH